MRISSPRPVPASLAISRLGAAGRRGRFWLGALFAALGIVHAADLPSSHALVQTFSNPTLPIRDAVWALARADDGTLFVGSNTLALFSSGRWERIAVPGAYAFRALAAASNRVYVGGSGALGFVERDAAGHWNFRPLLDPRTPDVHGDTPGEVWSVHPFPGGAVFVTTGAVLRWREADHRIDRWTMPSPPHPVAASVGDTTYVYQEGQGLWRIEPTGEPILAVPAAQLPGYPMTWLAAANGDRTELLVGLGNHVYAWKPAAGLRFERSAELSAALQDTVPTRAVRLDDGRLALGTFKAGLLLAQRAGDTWTTTRLAGLPDDNVYTLLPAPAGGLWAGTGGGLALVESVGTAALVNLPASAGRPQAVVSAPDQTWVVAGKAVAAAGAAQPLAGTPPLLWDAVAWRGQLWLAGFGGIWRAEKTGAVQEHVASTDVFRLLVLRSRPDELLFIEGNAVRSLVQGPTGWAARDTGVTLPDPPASWVEDAGGQVWISTIKGEVFCYGVEAREDRRLQLRLKSRMSDLPGIEGGDLAPRFVVNAGRVLALTGIGLLRQAGESAALTRVAWGRDFVELAGAGGADAVYIVLQSEALKATGEPVLARLRWTPDAAEPTVEFLAAPGLAGLGGISLAALTGPDPRPVLWIGGKDGLLRFETSALRPLPDPPRVRLRRIGSAGSAAAMAAADVARGDATAPASSGSWSFRFAAADAGADDPVYFQTRLVGAETAWSAPQRETERAFTGLAAGAYGFEVRTIDRAGRVGPVARAAFTIAAPWYRRTAAWLGYLVAAGLLGLAFGRWRMRQLRRQNQRLDRLVRERTRQLELANTAKGEFLENISHEIRNPLNGIVGVAGMLRADELPPREQALTRSLQECAGRLQRVAEEVLGFSKIEFGEAAVDVKPFRLAEVLQDVVGLHATFAEQQASTVAVALPEGWVDGFEGDPAKLRTVLSNFVSNALKYAPGTPVVVAVEVADGTGSEPPLDRKGRPPQPAIVTIEVRDQGPGIPVEEQELIFQKFVRGTQAKAQGVVGTGLGLAACRALAQKLGGQIGVESGPGAGATFYLQLPLRRARVPEGAASDDGAAEAREALPPSRALVVEDEEYNRIVLRGLLEELGFATTVAAEAGEAKRQLEQTTFAVVFLDWELPGAKGGEVSRWLRRQPGPAARTLIVATTAHDSDEMRARCLAAGMDEFLLKPYSVASVRAALGRTGKAPARASRGGVPTEHTEHTESENKTGAKAADGAEELIDFAALRFYSRGDPARVGQEVPHFLAAVGQRLEEMRRAERTEALVAAAHGVGALAGMAGARGLHEAAKVLQQRAAGVTAAERVRLRMAVETEFAALRERLG